MDHRSHVLDLPEYERDGEDHPDPLAGKLGWTFRDHVNIVVAVCLIATIVGLVIPLLTPLREAEARARHINKTREVQLDLHTKRWLGGDVPW